MSKIDNNFPSLKNDRILKAARGEIPDKLPIWIMRQAGRHLPEFREFREGHSFFEICKNAEYATEVTLMPIRRYDLDASIIFSDILVIPEALGLEVEMRAGIWTLMGYMIEGGGSKTYSKARKWLYAFPKESHQLLNILTNVIIDYLVLQIEHGAQIVQVFDSNAEYLNKDLYKDFCLPYLKRISEEVRSKLRDKKLDEVPMVLFAKGGWYCLEEQADLGYEVIGVDWTVDPKFVRNIFKNKNITLQGNLDPCALYAPIGQLKSMVQKMLEEFGHERYIVNLGHGIYPDAPIDAVHAIIDVVHKYNC
ncbi:uroporphyrinogen decarboxylase isoform X2 [Rhynchophorus ferrugineus]|uniref:uroporphyrinogen decarboxylase isoform X2 n=1 Tax=Rhynchophorus ferrugineus TaxID=354439 RepID=UPI003FCE25BC